MYKEKKVKYKNIFSFWNNFKDEEKFLFYDYRTKELLIGAKRLKAISEDENFNRYKYIFSTKTFFSLVKDGIWDEFKSENIVFSYYLKIKDGEQILYYEGDDINITEVTNFDEVYTYKVNNDDYKEWEKLFYSVHKKIVDREIQKIVISREVKVDIDQEVKEEILIKRLLEKNKANFVFAYSKNNKCFLGATPEILVQKEGEKIISHAVAGTLIKDGKASKEDLLNDEKNCYEQGIVVSHIKKILEAYGHDTETSERGIIETKNLYHLHTTISTRSNENIIKWRNRLHPTAAIGGMPRDKALQIIIDNENHERGLYSSPIGVIDEYGNGVFVVGLRSGLLCKDKLYAYAGCGIVEDSKCEKEYIETTGKMKTILECL